MSTKAAPKKPTSADIEKNNSMPKIANAESMDSLERHHNQPGQHHHHGAHGHHKKKPFKKKFMGDLFGTQRTDILEGLMYRARILEETASLDPDDKRDEVQENEDNEKTLIDEDDDAVSDEEKNQMLIKTLNPKQLLATTIKNWTATGDNDSHLIKEGAAHAIIALSSVDDPLIRKCCAYSFRNLSSRAANREELLSIGITTGVINLALQARSW